jgi:predicted secreted Zn-dependent protease
MSEHIPLKRLSAISQTDSSQSVITAPTPVHSQLVQTIDTTSPQSAASAELTLEPALPAIAPGSSGHQLHQISIFPKLAIGQADDPVEPETDPVNEHIMRTPIPIPIHQEGLGDQLMREDDGSAQPTDTQNADAIPMGPGGSNGITNFSVTSKTRAVSGKTLTQVWDSMTSSGTREAASVLPELKPIPQYEYDANDKVTKVTINVNEIKEMPQWTELGEQCPPIKNEWNRFYGVLDRHEENHIAIDRKHYTNVHQKLLGKPRQTAWDTLDKVVEAANKENEAYDTNSNHGLNEGTKINGAVQCGVEKLSESGMAPPEDVGQISDIPNSDTTMAMAKRMSHAAISPPPVRGHSLSQISIYPKQTLVAEPSTVPDSIAQRIQAASGGGGQLDEGVQQHLEQHLGADLSGVRIHTDGEADRLSRSVNAIAFTTGQDIFFSSGSYDPSSSEGQHLIAHEVVHTVQQANGAVAGTATAGGVSISDPSDAFEQEAEQVANQVMRMTETIATPKASQPLLTHQSAQASIASIQRWPWSADRTDRQRIDDAIRNRSVSDAKAISDINAATESERITLIDILSHQGWVGPRDETQIERLWNSFGRNLPQLMEANEPLWEHCIAVGAELEDIQAVRNLRSEFRRDIQITAAGYLAGNRTVVGQEMRQFGISEEEGETARPMTAEQDQRLREMQQAAQIVAQMQRGQEDLQRVEVGYAHKFMQEDPQGTPALFDPAQQPDSPPDAGDQTMRPWATVKAEYDRTTTIIASLTDKFPALYAVSREGQSTQTQQFADASSPAAARAQLAPALRRLINHIANAQTKLRDGDINPLDLLPIHQQLLFEGRATASGIDWKNRKLPHSAAEQERASHQAEQFWTRLGLTSLSAAAFILAPFTGGASLLVELVALGAAGAQAMISTERYQALAASARTEVKSGTALVNAEQVSVAETQMQADQVALAIAALLVAVGLVSRVARGLGGSAVVPPAKGADFGSQMAQEMKAAGFRGNPFREFMQRLNALPKRLPPQEAAQAIEVATREFSGGSMGTMPPVQYGDVLVVPSRAPIPNAPVMGIQSEGTVIMGRAPKIELVKTPDGLPVYPPKAQIIGDIVWD